MLIMLRYLFKQWVKFFLASTIATSRRLRIKLLFDVEYEVVILTTKSEEICVLYRDINCRLHGVCCKTFQLNLYQFSQTLREMLK